MSEAAIEKQPAWKAWTYQRRLERFTTINPEAEPPPLPGPVITSTLLTILDIRAGRRSWRSIESFTTAAVHQRLRVQDVPTGRLRKVRVFRPSPWSVEVAAVLARPDRCAALALRWDWIDGEWTVTALEG
jgi:hypothetical protein